MSKAEIQLEIARLMIAECDHVLTNVIRPGVLLDEALILIIGGRKAYWEKVEEQAQLTYSIEGVE